MVWRDDSRRWRQHYQRWQEASTWWRDGADDPASSSRHRHRRAGRNTQRGAYISSLRKQLTAHVARMPASAERVEL